MIRKVTPQDRAAFLDLAWEFYHSPAVLHPVPHSYIEATFDEMMRSEDYLLGYLLCDETGAHVGYALLSRSFSPEVGGPIIWLEEIYLREGARGKGMGHAFFDYLHTHLPAARYRLEVESDNHRAKALYRSLGYELLGYEQMVRDTQKI